MAGRKPLDLTGQRFGKLRALRKTDQRKGDGSVVWECLCEACGRTCYVKSSSLKSGDRKSCGCLHNKHFKPRKRFQPAEDCAEYDKENHCCKILNVLECECEYYCVFYEAMREILFRGKRMDNGEWVEGFLVVGTDRINNGKCYILPGISDFSYGDNGNRIRIGGFVEVDPETIGQFTGLTDKNSKKIFEGDVVLASDTDTAIVEYDETAAMFMAVFGYADADFTSLCNQHPNVEVIGNVFDNPELLKGGAENG